jgi:hypothetical protein
MRNSIQKKSRKSKVIKSKVRKSKVRKSKVRKSKVRKSKVRKSKVRKSRMSMSFREFSDTVKKSLSRFIGLIKRPFSRKDNEDNECKYSSCPRNDFLNNQDKINSRLSTPIGSRKSSRIRSRSGKQNLNDNFRNLRPTQDLCKDIILKHKSHLLKESHIDSVNNITELMCIKNYLEILRTNSNIRYNTKYKNHVNKLLIFTNSKILKKLQMKDYK